MPTRSFIRMFSIHAVWGLRRYYTVVRISSIARHVSTFLSKSFFFFPRPFPPARWYVQSVPRPPTLCRRLWPLHERAGRRLAGTWKVWRASASTSARGGSVPSHSSAISSGSSKIDHAKARCAATANMPAQRWLVACRAAARRRGGAARAFEAAMRRRKSANSAPKRPPKSDFVKFHHGPNFLCSIHFHQVHTCHDLSSYVRRVSCFSPSPPSVAPMLLSSPLDPLLSPTPPPTYPPPPIRNSCAAWGWLGSLWRSVIALI